MEENKDKCCKGGDGINCRAKEIHKILTDDGWATEVSDHNKDGFRLEKDGVAICVLDVALKDVDVDLESITAYIEGGQPKELSEGGNQVAQTKQFRKDLDEVLQRVKLSDRQSRERSLCVTKLQEAIMWLGMDLKAQNEENPYPESYNPDSPAIEPTADGLKM